MNSVRVKLILVVVAVALAGLGAVIVSSLSIVREASRDQMRSVNRQLSEVVSRTVVNQVQDYRRDLELIFNSWSQKPDFVMNSELAPDLVWVTFVDVTQKKYFEWSNEVLVAEMGIQPDELLGFKGIEKLVDELQLKTVSDDSWVALNSTIKTFYPTFILGTSFEGNLESNRRFIVLAEVRLDRLLEVVKGRRGQDLVLIDSHDNVLLSTKESWDPGELTYPDQNVLKLIRGLNPGDNRFVTVEYEDRPAQLTSLFSLKEGGGLGLVMQEPASVLKKTEQSVQNQALIITFIVLILMVNLLVFLASSFMSPLSELTQLMERAGKGEFSGQVKVRSKDEIGRLGAVFNKMIADLKARDEEIERGKSRLIQSEKMSAFGQMSAGIAHEVKNPLAGILGYAQMSKKKLPVESEVTPYLDIIEKETVRCKEIVDNLMRFARQEKAEMSRMDLNKTIRDSVKLVEHQISISGIKIQQNFALEGAPIWMMGNPNQLQQVMMNLMLNAQQAMENKGNLSISTVFDNDQKKVTVVVSDTGPGMSAEVKARIFEPFFTTKGSGKGTGLGLSVTLGIVKDHSGVIEVESELGKGTTFQIILPTDGEQSPSSEQTKVA